MIKALDFNEPMILVASQKNDDEDQSVVAVDKKGFVCLCCKHGRHSCRHVKCINTIVKNQTMPDSLVEVVRRSEVLQKKHQNAYIRKPLSTGKISLETLPHQRSVYVGSYSNAVMETVESSLLVPDFDGDNCRNCGERLNEHYVWQPRVKLISRNFIKLVSGMWDPFRSFLNVCMYDSAFLSRKGMLGIS